MTFQFLCPQGHLLEGEEAQMGQPCDCPMCGMRFIIPTIAGANPSEQANQGYENTGYGNPSYDNPGYGGGQADPGYDNPSYGGYQSANQGFDYASPDAGPIDPFAAGAEAPDPFGGAIGGAESPIDAEPKLLHIPCPAGHELETPPEMVGQDVLCPYCGVQFNLRYKDSTEYKAERAAELERKELKAGKLWFQWAIIAAVIVVGSLIGMIVYSISTSG